MVLLSSFDFLCREAKEKENKQASKQTNKMMNARKGKRKGGKKEKRGLDRDWTGDLSICSRMLYRWATNPLHQLPVWHSIHITYYSSLLASFSSFLSSLTLALVSHFLCLECISSSSCWKLLSTCFTSFCSVLLVAQRSLNCRIFRCFHYLIGLQRSLQSTPFYSLWYSQWLWSIVVINTISSLSTDRFITDLIRSWWFGIDCTHKMTHEEQTDMTTLVW